MGIVGVPMITGKPDVAACMADRSASIFERVYRPGISLAGKASYPEAACCDEGNRIDSVEQCRKRETPRLRAAARTISVPWKLTASKSSFRGIHMPGKPAR